MYTSKILDMELADVCFSNQHETIPCDDGGKTKREGSIPGWWSTTFHYMAHQYILVVPHLDGKRILTAWIGWLSCSFLSRCYVDQQIGPTLSS